jgi:hypothetical protein
MKVWRQAVLVLFFLALVGFGVWIMWLRYQYGLPWYFWFR